jgi:L-amino acid N-acyltransferase YncA
MVFHLAPITPEDREATIDIYNHYIEHTFAAYLEEKVPYEFFDNFLSMCKGYPTAVARNEEGQVIGFGILRSYNPMPTFSDTAEISYFLKPGFTGKGIGKGILEHLAVKGKEKGLKSILATVSSLNEGSIRFHLRNGFAQCGHFKCVVRKKGRTFDVLYFQRVL